jgi:hypothetical protein
VRGGAAQVRAGGASGPAGVEVGASSTGGVPGRHGSMAERGRVSREKEREPGGGEVQGAAAAGREPRGERGSL